MTNFLFIIFSNYCNRIQLCEHNKKQQMTIGVSEIFKEFNEIKKNKNLKII